MNKFLSINAGIKTLYTAIISSGGVGDANKIIQTGNDGKLDATLLPSGLGAATESMVTSEALAAGDFVNIYLVSTIRTARKADASNGRVAHGFVLTSVASAGTASVILQGTNTALTGLTAGVNYYLSATSAGTISNTAPTLTSGNTIQNLGYAISATAINFEFNEGIFVQ